MYLMTNSFLFSSAAIEFGWLVKFWRLPKKHTNGILLNLIALLLPSFIWRYGTTLLLHSNPQKLQQMPNAWCIYQWYSWNSNWNRSTMSTRPNEWVQPMFYRIQFHSFVHGNIKSYVGRNQMQCKMRSITFEPMMIIVIKIMESHKEKSIVKDRNSSENTYKKIIFIIISNANHFDSNLLLLKK